MQHVFSSGEILYQQNIRELEEGKFTAETIFYDNITEGLEYESLGDINGRKARIRFRLDDSSEEKVLFRKTLNILMQSDIIQARWENYHVEWLEE